MDPMALYLAMHLRIKPEQAERLIDEARKAVASVWRPLFTTPPRAQK